MANVIPASYLANGGKVTFEDDAGTIYWSVAFGNYTGSNAGNNTNDPDGNFGSPVTGLPTGSLRALLFQGSSTAASTTNLADYALTSGAATFTNNAGTGATLTPESGIVGVLLVAGLLPLRRRRRMPKRF
jgi:hypothetical protein